MDSENKETSVEYAHSIEEALEPLASKDPKTINGFLTTSLEHPSSRLSIWGLATLLRCDPNQYPEVNDLPEIRKLRQGDLTEEEKRYLFDSKAIDGIKELTLNESEIEFRLVYPSPDEAPGRKGDDLRKVNKELADLNKFRQDLRLKKGSGPSVGEAPGKPSV